MQRQTSLARRGSAYPVWKGFQEGCYYIVSNDTHYDVLSDIKFPKLLVLKLQAFIEKLKQ